MESLITRSVQVAGRVLRWRRGREKIRWQEHHRPWQGGARAPGACRDRRHPALLWSGEASSRREQPANVNLAGTTGASARNWVVDRARAPILTSRAGGTWRCWRQAGERPSRSARLWASGCEDGMVNGRGVFDKAKRWADSRTTSSCPPDHRSESVRSDVAQPTSWYRRPARRRTRRPSRADSPRDPEGRARCRG
jgi:hypothetical protein